MWRRTPNRAIIPSLKIPFPHASGCLAGTRCAAGQQKVLQQSLPRQGGRRPGSASADATVGMWRAATRPTAERGKETLLGEDARVAPAGKKPGLSRLPRPDGAGPRRAASLRSPATPPTPPPHRYSPPAPRGPRRAAHAPSAPHHAPEKAAIFAHSPAAHSLRPALPPRRRARDAGGASFRSAPFGVPIPGGDADPGQRFRERKDSSVCLHNAAVL